MKLFIERKYYKDGYIIGRLYINGEFICNTLEPPRGTAMQTITTGSCKAIAPGTYRVQMYLSPRFKTRLPLLQNVPGRSGILIHAGNTVKNTQGCILVGMNTKVGSVMNSKKCLKKIIDAVSKAEAEKEPVVITIR